MNELGREPRPPTSFTFQPRGHSPPPSREPAPDHHSPWVGWNSSPETDLHPRGGLRAHLSQHLGPGNEHPHPSHLRRGLWGTIGERLFLAAGSQILGHSRPLTWDEG